jgi:hypothetical protein
MTVGLGRDNSGTFGSEYATECATGAALIHKSPD